MDLELCAGSFSSALKANHFPFKRIELCCNLSAGGLTPSAGTIVSVIKNVKAECHVLIRPRIGNFNYSKDEIKTMVQDIAFCKTIGCKGVVFGVMDSNNRFDLENNLILLDACQGLETTFHKAIDTSNNILHDLESIINCGFNRVLTSGGETNINKGITALLEMKNLANKEIELMIGGGINATNILNLKEKIKPNAIHFSASETISPLANNMYAEKYLESSSKKIKTTLNALNL